MSPLDQLESHVSQLLDERRQLREECSQLKQQNGLLEDKVFELRKQLEQLRERHRQLQCARALSESDERKQDARRMIDSILGRIDKAIETIRQ